MPHRMGGVDLLGQPEDVNDLEMAIDAKNADKDGMIDVPDAEVADADFAEAAVADLGLEEADVSDLDVPIEELHSTSCNTTRYAYRFETNGLAFPWKDCRKKLSAIPSDLHLHRDHQKIAQTTKECQDRTPHHKRSK